MKWFPWKDAMSARLFQIKFVTDQAELENYEKKLYTALNAAGYYIQTYLDSKFNKEEQEWAFIKAKPLILPNFQHLCFRLGSNVYSVIIALGDKVNGFKVDKNTFEKQLKICEYNNMIPTIIPLYESDFSFVFEDSHLINSKNKEILIPKKNKEPQQMSHWERLDLGIHVVLEHLEQQNVQILSYSDNPEDAINIWFNKNGASAFVVVRSIPIGKRKEKFLIDKNLLLSNSAYEGFFADVQFASSSAILKDEYGNIVPLSKRDGDEDVWMWRGDDFYCNFIGLQNMDMAINNNDFIEIV